MKEKILTPDQTKEMFFEEVVERVDREIDRSRETSSLEKTALIKAPMILHKTKEMQKIIKLTKRSKFS